MRSGRVWLTEHPFILQLSPLMGWPGRAPARDGVSLADRATQRTRPISSTFTSTIATIGVDLGKNTFHLVGLDRRGAIVSQLKLSRGQIERRLANVAPCLIGMETCSGSHHIGRRWKSTKARSGERA